MKRNDYPTLNAPSADSGGAVLTRAMVDSLHAWFTSDEYRENCCRAEEEHHRQLNAMNAELKRQFAMSLGKNAEQLTKKDMSRLNESLFQAFLKYKGVTEEEFWEWLG